MSVHPHATSALPDRPIEDLTSWDRRVVLAARTHYRWGTVAIGSSPGVTYQHSDRTWVVDVLVLIFDAALHRCSVDEAATAVA